MKGYFLRFPTPMIFIFFVTKMTCPYSLINILILKYLLPQLLSETVVNGTYILLQFLFTVVVISFTYIQVKLSSFRTLYSSLSKQNPNISLFHMQRTRPHKLLHTKRQSSSYVLSFFFFFINFLPCYSYVLFHFYMYRFFHCFSYACI